MNKIKDLIDQLEQNHTLTESEYRDVIVGYTPQLAEYAAKKADKLRREIYGNTVYIRGLIEISNICKNDCLYCGIRKSNGNCQRYRLNKEQILSCCRTGYQLGFRTFVLQGGEDGYFTDAEVCSIVSFIKKEYSDCAVTLSLGERSYESYKAMYDAGANRYLLRHETADRGHYQKLHPNVMSFDNRMRCLQNLKKIGYQTGCGFMVESPYQTAQTLAKDLKFIEEFQPEMCGIGPFVPHKDTEFAHQPAGTLEKTLYLLSLIRLIHPHILLPATTALGTIHPKGRELGILAGANVVMPNLSPADARSKYTLYDNKINTGAESAEKVKLLSQQMASIGYEVVIDRGDYVK